MIQGDLSEVFIINKGLRQGGGLSCLLFNFALKKVIKDTGLQMTGKIQRKFTEILAYAYDIDIIGTSKREVELLFLALENAARCLGSVEPFKNYMLANPPGHQNPLSLLGPTHL